MQPVPDACVSCSRPEPDRLVDFCWNYACGHQDGLTLDIESLTAPENGIVVAYEATLNMTGKSGMIKAIEHARSHSRILGGWRDPDDGSYYFDSDTLFLESMLPEALEWGRRNRQKSVFILSTRQSVDID